MLYLVIFGEKFLSYSPKISKKKLVTPLDEIRSTLTAHRGEILYSRGRISTCKTVYIEFLCIILLSVPVE